MDRRIRVIQRTDKAFLEGLLIEKIHISSCKIIGDKLFTSTFVRHNDRLDNVRDKEREYYMILSTS